MSWVWPPQPRRFTAEDEGLFDEPRRVKVVQPKVQKPQPQPEQLGLFPHPNAPGSQSPFSTSGMDGFRWSDAIGDDRMYDALVAKYHAASPEVKQWGTDWYDTANQYVRNLASATGRSVEQVAGVMAAFSPRTAWDPSNMSQATHFLLNYDPNNPDAIGPQQWPGLSENLKRAKRVLAGGDDHNSVLATLAGAGDDAPKITNFYKNIMGDHDAVTIDAWMARALLGQGEEMSDPDKASNMLTWAGAYDKMSDAVRRAAKDLGVTPRELQAIVWTHVNPTADYNELTPDTFKALEQKRTKNWQRNPPRKPLPDYTKGPAWDAVDKKGNPILPSPDYSGAPGLNRGARLAFLLKQAINVDDLSEDELQALYQIIKNDPKLRARLQPRSTNPFSHIMLDSREPSGKWYHVSPHDLAEGTVLVPGGPDGKATSQDFYDMGFGDDTGTLQDMGGGRTQHVWLTPDLDDAHFWAASLGAPHIYEVEPDDDPRPWNGTGTDGFVTPGARIKRKILSRRMARMKLLLRTAAGDARKITFTPEEEGLIAELMSRLEYKRETGQLPHRHPSDPQGFTDVLQELIQRNKEREYFDEDEYDYDKAYNDQIAGEDE